MKCSLPGVSKCLEIGSRLWKSKATMTVKIVCHELSVMTRVANDIQSSSRQNSGSRHLVLKPLPYYTLDLT